jgi:hypothetical protein
LTEIHATLDNLQGEGPAGEEKKATPQENPTLSRQQEGTVELFQRIFKGDIIP